MANKSDIEIYQSEDGLVKIDVRLDDETVWLTQAQMVDLFRSSKANISEHISHVFDEGELVEESVVRKFRTTGADGKSYNTKHYNLDVIISVGYRVKSLHGTQFRQWATKRLNEYIRKGFTLDDDAEKPMVEMTNFKGDYITKTDVGIAKNYLTQREAGGDDE